MLYLVPLGKDKIAQFNTKVSIDPPPTIYKTSANLTHYKRTKWAQCSLNKPAIARASRIVFSDEERKQKKMEKRTFGIPAEYRASWAKTVNAVLAFLTY